MARKRVDPKSQPADGFRAWDRFHNLDEDRKYVCANPNDEMSGVEMYLALGYEIELKRPGGPRPFIGKTVADGQAVTVNGQVLMSKPLDAFEAEEVRPGQARADALDRRILKDGNIEDGLRGQTHRIGVDRDQTSAAFVEHEGA